VAVAIDTSGSTSEDLPTFMSELKSLLKEFQRVEVTLIECDAEITRVGVFSEDTVDQLDKSSFKGGGGTDFRPPFRYLEDKPPACLIYLTDGYGQAPKKPPVFPVLWVVTKDGTAPADWGQLVYLK
jgi:predicted metal-dependent peptidase